MDTDPLGRGGWVSIGAPEALHTCVSLVEGEEHQHLQPACPTECCDSPPHATPDGPDERHMPWQRPVRCLARHESVPGRCRQLVAVVCWARRGYGMHLQPEEGRKEPVLVRHMKSPRGLPHEIRASPCFPKLACTCQERSRGAPFLSSRTL